MNRQDATPGAPERPEPAVIVYNAVAIVWEDAPESQLKEAFPASTFAAAVFVVKVPPDAVQLAVEFSAPGFVR